MLHLFVDLECHTGIMVLLALIFILFYEAINGFHDTANAVATVIYTRALRSQVAVALSGIFNFLGVIMGGLSVAYAIVHLLPTDLLMNINSSNGLAMILSMLMAAIMWNLWTWYFGLPASSSHTLIGAIIGVTVTHALLTERSVIALLNFTKLSEIFLSLIISPLVGMVLAGAMIFILRRYWSQTKTQRRIHLTPVERERQDGQRKPPFWTRIALIVSAAGVSFSHGANDGQKGIGLTMLVLISVAPAGFLVNMNASDDDINRTRNAVSNLQQYYAQHNRYLNKLILHDPSLMEVNNEFISIDHKQELTVQKCDISWALIGIHHFLLLIDHLPSYDKLNPEQRLHVRRMLMCISDITDKLAKLPEIPVADKRFLSNLRLDLLDTIEYAPLWITIAIALALSLGTMIGWHRVSTTIGEKIGKKDMTYAQGLSAQMTTAVAISIASYTGMPVSTTHVLSAAVTGTMLVEGCGVQGKTVTNILMAWILTLPVSIILAGSLYWMTMQLLIST